MSRNTMSQDELNLLVGQGQVIQMLPLEDWLAALERAESIAPILDPTLYRDYLYSGNGELIKGLLCSAIAFRQSVERLLDAAKAKGRT